MIVNTNVSGINSWRSLYKNDVNLSKSLEKLSSGLRINRSSDDAGGLGVSETLRAQMRGLAAAERNTQDAMGYMNIVDSTSQNVHDMLQRMRELAVQSANGTLNATDRGNIDAEFQSLKVEIGRELTAAQYNGTAVFAAGPVQFQVGANAADTMSITIGSITTTTLGVNTDVLTSQGAATTAITNLTSAITTMSTNRANFGAFINRLEYTLANDQVTRENLTAAESRIRDTDMAAEMTNMTKQQILTQSATAMLGQANVKPQSVLRLLQ